MMENKVIIYTANDGKTKIDVKLEKGELNEESVVRKFRTTAADGKEYLVSHYNLDMIIAQGTPCNGTTCIRIFGFCGASGRT